jgi:hypothetical protein
MTGHRLFTELTKGFTPARRACVEAKAAALREEMTLEELRKSRDLSQEEIAQALAVGQPAVAKAGEAHGHVRQQPAPLYRGLGREAGDYGSFPGCERRDQQRW